MGRLIEVENPLKCPSGLTVQTDDVLLFRATGGCVRSGGDVVEMLGPFIQAILAENGNILTPQGPPNAVLFRPYCSGQAVIDVITGDPFHERQTTAWDVTVES